MNHVLIKMCGITRPEDAFLAAQEGVDLIGMIFSKTSQRCINPAQAMSISSTAKKANVKTVGVFYENSFADMQKIVEEIKLDYAQLHSSQAIQQGYQLSIPKIYVLQPGMGIDELPDFNSDVDMILFDAPTGGTGLVIDWSNISVPSGVKWLLAGGLNPHNVVNAIEQLEPTGVDVASGIETGVKGIKDPKLIKQFVEAVRYAEARRTL